MERSSQHVTDPQPEFSISAVTMSPANGQVAADLALPQSGHNISQIRFTSHRKVLGPFVIALKKGLRQLPYGRSLPRLTKKEINGT
jgi:hypothetical protein